MNKKVLSLIIVSTILLLVGWTNIGDAPNAQMSKTIVTTIYPRSGAPDYFADGKFFKDAFLQHTTTDSHPWTADYAADAEIFYSEYLNLSPSGYPLEIPDYPLDGKFFVEHLAEMP